MDLNGRCGPQWKLWRWVQLLSAGYRNGELKYFCLNLKNRAFEWVVWATVEAADVSAVVQQRERVL